MNSNSAAELSLGDSHPDGYVRGVILPPLKRIHRKASVVASVLLVAMIVAVGGGFWSYHNRLLRKHFPASDLKPIGLTTTLRTELIEGKPHYAFSARPDAESTKVRLDEVVRSKPANELRFAIHLLDDDGFELCEQEISWQPNLGSDGTVMRISGSGEIADCPKARYSQATSWKASFNYPKLNEQIKTGDPAPVAQQNTPTVPLVKPSNVERGSESTIVDTDRLTGADFLTGAIETLSGKSLRVRREAEWMTLNSWQPNDQLQLSCKGAACLVTNTDRDESVHAALSRD